MKNKFFGFIFLGALLVVALFFFRQQRDNSDVLGQATSEAPKLKPSQLNFSMSNKPVDVAQREPSMQPAGSVVQKKNEIWSLGDSLKGDDAAKWQTLRQVIESKNDNDPRLDRDLKHMSEAMHRALRDTYQKFPMENRNERGTIVFLLTRDLKSTEDLNFLKAVYDEQPCTSFESCNQVPSEDAHLSAIDEASLSYPQRAGLYQLSAVIAKHPELMNDPKFRDMVRAVLDSASNFPVPAVRKKAAELRQAYFQRQ